MPVSSGATGQRNAAYGEGTGPILLSRVQCNGSETTLFGCPNGVSTCTHSDDAGVTCTASKFVCVQYCLAKSQLHGIISNKILFTTCY